MPQGWDLGVLGVKNFSMEICEGAPSNLRSSFQFSPKVLVFHDVIIVYVGICVAFEEVTSQ